LCKEADILSKLQNGIAQTAKLDLLTKFGENRFEDGKNMWIGTIRKMKDVRLSKIKCAADKLLDELRVEIWEKSKEENEVITELIDKIRETSIRH
jgi:hypothetical protein